MNKKTIVLFKGTRNEYSSENKGDPYLEILKKNGIFASVIPILQFNYVNQETLCDLLKRAEDFTGIIFTSPRAVEAVSQVICLPELSLSSWKSKSNYSVGKTTSSLTRTLLGLETTGEDTGSGEKLCDFILSRAASTSTFLFPCSNIRKDTIPRLLSDQGMKIIEVVCYETVVDSALNDNWKKLVSEQSIPKILIYFSPSGVAYSHPVIQSTYHSCQPKCIAVGPVTAQALIEKSMYPVKICNSPTPESVLDAVKCVIAD